MADHISTPYSPQLPDLVLPAEPNIREIIRERQQAINFADDFRGGLIETRVIDMLFASDLCRLYYIDTADVITRLIMSTTGTSDAEAMATFRAKWISLFGWLQTLEEEHAHIPAYAA